MKLFPKPEWTIHGAAAALRRGARTSVDLVHSCLAAIDEREQEVRAWVLIDREGALGQAAARDAELTAGQDRGPLHGIPLAIKDIFDVAGMPTAAGYSPWQDRIAAVDAAVVDRLRRGGAVILGKTVTTQFASFDPPVTRNPWKLDRTPGGSSSGSAAALAADMCLGAMGSQTGGSITRPASYCGVAGCKPTYGRVSAAGVLPLAPSMDHPGPMARTVRDLAILLDAIAGPDPADPTCVLSKYAPCTPCLEIAPNLIRLGRLRGLFEEKADPQVRHAFGQACEILALAGGDVADIPLPPSFDRVLASHRTIMAVEAAAWHEDRFQSERAHYQPRIAELIQEGLAASPTAYARARQHQVSLSRQMLGCFQNTPILLAPATTTAAPDAATTGDPAFNSPWSLTGLPVVSFPVSLSAEGLPIAIQLIGAPFQEAELLRAAAWCESVIRNGID